MLAIKLNISGMTLSDFLVIKPVSDENKEEDKKKSKTVVGPQKLKDKLNSKSTNYPTLIELIYDNIDKSNMKFKIDDFKFLGKSQSKQYAKLQDPKKPVIYSGSLDKSYIKSAITVGSVTNNIHISEKYYKGTDIKLSDMVNVLENGMVTRNIKALNFIKKAKEDFRLQKIEAEKTPEKETE